MAIVKSLFLRGAHRVKIRHIVVAAVLAASPLAAWSADAAAQLRKFIADVPSATGQFTQQRVDKQAAGQTSTQSGEFSFNRPGQFKWAVTKPYEQLILSDGKKLYQYDPDLAQVTERGVSHSIGASPAAILFGSGSLDQNFELAERPSAAGIDWLRATPRGADAGFSYVDIGFRDALPVRLEILDSFGQTTRIDLSNINIHPKLGAKEFTFTPPDGVDVVSMQ